jgi:hypothetical protein
VKDDRHVKKLTLALCLAAIATPLQSEESLVGTAWQCGRDYLQVTFFGLGGAAQEATIWPNMRRTHAASTWAAAGGRAKFIPLEELPKELPANLSRQKAVQTVLQSQTAEGIQMSDPHEWR